MLVPLSLKHFRQRLDESGLIAQADLQALLAELPEESRPADGEELARLLVQRKKLTAFQAQQIYAGKGKALKLGNYAILDKLGQGGMGLVYKAEHRRMERQVALKVLSKAVTKDPDAARRFQREVKAAAKLDHPNIVTAHDADEANGTHFLVMQLVDGTDLAALVREKGPLSIDQALACVTQSARGLEYAHSRGVVHRDIKPSNLLLDREGTVRILDMGLARIESADPDQDQLTGTGQVMGTIDYMAPEQAKDMKTADARADIYSLGATLWYLLTGRVVYEANTVVKKLMDHQNEPIPSLREACPGASADLEAVFTKMVAKTPDERYGSMTDVIAELERCATGSSSAPSVVTAAREDSKLSAFLRDIRSSQGSAVAAKSERRDAARKGAVSSGAMPTATFRSAHADTDPQTQLSLGMAAGLIPIGTRSVSEGTDPIDEGARTSRGIPASVLAFPRSRVGLRCIAGGGVALATFAVLLATIVFFVRTKDGVIRVEIGDPSIEVAIKGTEILLKQADNGTDVKLTPGDKTLVVQRGDFQFETDKLILKRGDTLTVHVELLAGEIEVRQGDRVVGRRSLPSESVASENNQGTSGKGWRGWSANAPKPAIAPFNAEQAKKHQQEWAEYLGVPVEWENLIGMRFRLIPPGEFFMGSTPEEIEEPLKRAGGDTYWRGNIRSELPRHKVILTQPIYLGVHEVTQNDYESVMGTNPSHFAATGSGKDAVAGLDTKRTPVEMVHWTDAAEFCVRLSEKENRSPFYSPTGDTLAPQGNAGYRLPTEAVWEFAGRAGTTTKYWTGNDDDDVLRAAWVGANSEKRTHAVGELEANPFGLYDVHGNVWEWVHDWWSQDYYSHFEDTPAVDPSGPNADLRRVLRGGDWEFSAARSRIARRSAREQENRGYYATGIRVALPVEAVRRDVASEAKN
jgi:serine/threonine protein kinase/formylglycine-generating enzyme required for sulfatase activity